VTRPADLSALSVHAFALLERLERAANYASSPWVSGEALEPLGGNRYGARIDELRALGALIESRPGPGEWHLYCLTGWGEPRVPRRRFDLTDEQLRALAAGVLPDSVTEDARRVLGLDVQPELF
jgi:hypothetical protein